MKPSSRGCARSHNKQFNAKGAGMFKTTIAGSLPKPEWLAEPQKLWPQWKASGADLAAAKRDATLLWLKEQEDAGIDIVSDGEQSRQHFVHCFLEFVEGTDFVNKIKMGIRNNRYDAMVPRGVGPLQLNVSVPEVDAVSRALETTAVRLDQMLSRERRFSEDASHQLRTPLTSLRVTLEASRLDPNANRGLAIDTALEEVDRLERTIDDLLALARETPPSQSRTDLAAVLTALDDDYHGR